MKPITGGESLQDGYVEPVISASDLFATTTADMSDSFVNLSNLKFLGTDSPLSFSLEKVGTEIWQF